MPVERQSERLRTPLGRRDRVVLATAVIGAVVAGGVAFATHRHHETTFDATCVVVTVPSTMGGGTLRNCGAAARSFCRSQSALNDQIAAACRARGYATSATSS
jgi:hypothetical protein